MTTVLEGGEMVSVTPRPLFTPEKNQVPIVQKAGWALGPVWTGAENLAPTGIRFPDRPVRSQSLYRLSYPAHFLESCPLNCMQALRQEELTGFISYRLRLQINSSYTNNGKYY